MDIHESTLMAPTVWWTQVYLNESAFYPHIPDTSRGWWAAQRALTDVAFGCTARATSVGGCTSFYVLIEDFRWCFTVSIVYFWAFFCLFQTPKMTLINRWNSFWCLACAESWTSENQLNSQKTYPSSIPTFVNRIGRETLLITISIISRAILRFQFDWMTNVSCVTDASDWFECGRITIPIRTCATFSTNCLSRYVHSTKCHDGLVMNIFQLLDDTYILWLRCALNVLFELEAWLWHHQMFTNWLSVSSHPLTRQILPIVLMSCCVYLLTLYG